jgi:hypothetical protein
MELNLLSDVDLCKAVEVFKKAHGITYGDTGNFPLRIAILNEELEVFSDAFKRWLINLDDDNVMAKLTWGTLQIIGEMSERFKKYTCISQD